MKSKYRIIKLENHGQREPDPSYRVQNERHWWQQTLTQCSKRCTEWTTIEVCDTLEKAEAIIASKLKEHADAAAKVAATAYKETVVKEYEV